LSIVSSIKDWVRTLAAPADDPRLLYADAFQKHRDLLAKVRRAKARLAASRAELAAKLAEARAHQDQLRGSGGSDVFAQQLSEIVDEELGALEREVSELDREERELSVVEQRLAVQEQTFIARQQALSARYSAEEARVRIQEELGGVAGQLADLGMAVEKAEQRSDEAQARAFAIEQVAGLGAPVLGLAQGGPVAQQLASHYASEARIEESLPLKRLLGSGFKTLLELEYEYRQLQVVLGQRRETDPLSVTYVPALAEETYQQGLGTLGDALSLIRAIRSPGREKLERRLNELEQEVEALAKEDSEEARATIAFRREALVSVRERLGMVQRQHVRIEDLLHQCDECVSALNRTRVELAALKVEGSGTSVEAATESLRKAIDEAKAVQEELRSLGI
jgi:phage shock protein A